MGRHSSGSSPSLVLQQHLCYHLHHQRDCKHGSGAGVASKVWFSLLLWVLGISSVLLLSISYSPNPFGTAPLAFIGEELPAPEEYSGSGDDGELESCDLSVGKWIRDEKGPAYTNRSCRTLPESRICGRYGKVDVNYAKWRWKPEGCELPSFDGRRFLSIVRGKRMAFVGDSAAGSQMESLRCLLSQLEVPEDVQTNNEDRHQEWYYPSHDFTLMILWTRFLVVGEERIQHGSASGIFDVQLDRVDMSWASKLVGVDYLVVSSDRWFFRKIYLYEGGKLAGCVFCSDPNLKDHGVAYAIQRAVRTTLQHIRRCDKCGKLRTIFLRTFSPARLEDGSWSGGGDCNHSMPLDERNLDLRETYWKLRLVQLEELGRVQKKVNLGRIKFGALDVTRAMLMRGGGHTGSHWNNEWIKGYDDCSHWCLPGPIDMWNDMLLVKLTRSYV